MPLALDPPATASSDEANAALPLRNARWESFARIRATGLSQAAAYRQAGFADSRQAASRLAAKPLVCARIVWLKAQAAEASGSDSETAIVRLLDMADAADLSTATGAREAREALEEAWRRYGELCKLRSEWDKAGR